MTDAVELKPCPMCQGQARLVKSSGKVGRASPSRYWREHVECKNKKCGLRTADFKRPGMATSAWNTRTPDPAIATLTEERDKMAEALKAITTLGGNQSGDALTTKTGPNDAVARGIMYVTAREIARAALAQAGVTK